MSSFAYDWFSQHKSAWTERFGYLAGSKVHGLEIGCFEGRATEWLLQNIFTHPESSLTVIDPFNGGWEASFDSNVSIFGPKINKMKGFSSELLRTLSFNSLDWIYIDGNHAAANVLEDAILSWPLLKSGGWLVFDDYQWQGGNSKYDRPGIGIDAFLSVFGQQCSRILKGWQVVLQRK